MADTPKQQRDPDLVSFGSFAGLRNDVAEERLTPTDLALGDNVDLDNSGRLARRVGRTQLTSTPTHSVWSDNMLLAFCVQGAQLMRIALDFSLTPVFTGLTLGRPVSYVKVNDRVYFTNGRETGVFEGTSVRSWGLPVPPTPGAAILPNGLLLAGTYQFVTTYVRNDGQESGAGLAGRAQVASNGGLQFVFSPPADATITARNIYVTAPNGDVLYLAMTVPISATNINYAASSIDQNYDLKTQRLVAPPAGQIAGYYSGRMYVVVDDNIYPSEPYAYELFDLRKYIPLNGRGTLFAGLEDKERIDTPGLDSGIFVGTDRECGILVGSSPEEFQFVPKTDFGAIEGTLDFVAGSLLGDGSAGARKLPMWLTTQGICAGMPGMEIKNLTRNRYSFTAAGRGAALFEPNPNRFIVVSNF